MCIIFVICKAHWEFSGHILDLLYCNMGVFIMQNKNCFLYKLH